MIRNAEPAWFKSSYSSGPDGDSCVEIAMHPTPSTSGTPSTPKAPGWRLREAWSEFLTSV
jgi:hypothetical protein